MKTFVASQLLALVVFAGSTAYAGNVGVDLNIHLGDRYRAGSVREYVYREPVPTPVVEQVRFVYPEPLGFYVAVGVPYDLCYIGNSYYLFRDGYWLRSRSGRGPWIAQSHRELPWELRRQRVDRIRYYRQWRDQAPPRYLDGADCDHRRHKDYERDVLVEERPELMARRR